jgi:hypothetical protein
MSNLPPFRGPLPDHLAIFKDQVDQMIAEVDDLLRRYEALGFEKESSENEDPCLDNGSDIG